MEMIIGRESINSILNFDNSLHYKNTLFSQHSIFKEMHTNTHILFIQSVLSIQIRALPKT